MVMDKNESLIRKYGEQFRKLVKGNNPLTPHVIDYVKVGKYICEVSTDSYTPDPNDMRMVGVTVLDMEKGEIDTDLSQAFCDKKIDLAKAEAYKYIETLK